MEIILNAKTNMDYSNFNLSDCGCNDCFCNDTVCGNDTRTCEFCGCYDFED